MNEMNKNNIPDFLQKIACPVCRASNSFQPVCRRCTTDLSLICGTLISLARHLRAAVQSLHVGDFVNAQCHFYRCQAISSTNQLHQALAVVAWLNGQYQQAYQQYRAIHHG
ncbi:MAG: hypothetical protein R3B84_05755 [Zavarzinella sp.]